MKTGILMLKRASLAAKIGLRVTKNLKDTFSANEGYSKYTTVSTVGNIKADIQSTLSVVSRGWTLIDYCPA